MHHLVLWITAAIVLLGAVLTVSSVGKPRQPITPGSAAITVLIDFGLVVWLIATATGR
ncbi:hypothetical protein [Kitasatospora acidiphila]|uniref:hypothetical protein n=1 Tax=Kitasatospora acidiphila TaxID=2567942 RepID=UPI0015EFF6B4|nr:hypothetical protein [Kitasatospora acidiphila]